MVLGIPILKNFSASSAIAFVISVGFRYILVLHYFVTQAVLCSDPFTALPYKLAFFKDMVKCSVFKARLVYVIMQYKYMITFTVSSRYLEQRYLSGFSYVKDYSLNTFFSLSLLLTPLISNY